MYNVTVCECVTLFFSSRSDYTTTKRCHHVDGSPHQASGSTQMRATQMRDTAGEGKRKELGPNEARCVVWALVGKCFFFLSCIIIMIVLTIILLHI
jgi:hypothetical protein